MGTTGDGLGSLEWPYGPEFERYLSMTQRILSELIGATRGERSKAEIDAAFNCAEARIVAALEAAHVFGGEHVRLNPPTPLPLDRWHPERHPRAPMQLSSCRNLSFVEIAPEARTRVGGRWVDDKNRGTADVAKARLFEANEAAGYCRNAEYETYPVSAVQVRDALAKVSDDLAVRLVSFR